ncbi:MAG: translation elongation factor 4 [Elusimicrobiales bacterium]|nr:translation elongation factor 4 [Elusimicrobiales bacterium]
MNSNNIRNFSIIAHIDHGKSTLADRFIEITGAIPDRSMREQFLDAMELERERGITIKAKAIRMSYKSKDGNKYIFNLIDTPGHVDFSYEVSRALYACEGAILLVDATQGVEAQTLAHAQVAMSLGIKIIPVINKIDLEHANIERTQEDIWEILHVPIDTSLVSAKTGYGVLDLMERIIEEIPPPLVKNQNDLKALVFDSIYDSYKGVIVYVRVFDGSVKKGDIITFNSTKKIYKVEEVGYLVPQMKESDKIFAGEVGYIIAGIKDIHDVRIGDTIFIKDKESEPLPGFKDVKPVVFAGIFPLNSADFNTLKSAMEKLNLTDSSFTYQGESSKALGFGFRCGFMGLLHLDIIRQRIEREFSIPLIVTNPNVVYRVKKKVNLNSKESQIVEVYEPYVNARIITPVEYLDNVITLLKEKRGVHIKIDYISSTRVILYYDLPLAEIIIDFYDKLKSCSKGYASFDYEHADYRVGDIVKVEILVHGEVVDALSFMSHRDFAQTRGRELCERLKKIIPRHLFEVAIQARIEGKIVARENIAALRKDVLAKCYGGDVTRKRKLLEKQKEGKKKMKMIGSVEIPQEAFIDVLKIDSNKKN